MFKLDVLNYQNTIFYPVQNIFEIPYYELVKVEAMVKIFINNVLFFSDDYFPLLEFIYQFEKWKNDKQEVFEYNSIESDRNPIISFTIQNEQCIFDSIWRLTSQRLSVAFLEVLNEINDCKKNLLKIINLR